PVLVAPKLDNALIVGFATGVTVGSMLESPIKSVTCVELEPATVEASRFFEHVNKHPLNDPRTKLVIDDARSVVRRWDLCAVGADLSAFDGKFAIGARDVPERFPACADVSLRGRE